MNDLTLPLIILSQFHLLLDLFLLASINHKHEMPHLTVPLTNSFAFRSLPLSLRQPQTQNVVLLPIQVLQPHKQHCRR